MTTTPQPETAPVEQPPVQVVPQADSKLAQLHAMYAGAKAKADAAAEELKTITTAIKAELGQAAPGQPKVDLIGQGLPPLGLRHIESWRIDTRKLKAQDPETYVRYARKSESWALKPLGAGGGGE